MRAARVDANHGAIVKALRAIGAAVADTSKVGNGFPDLVVSMRARNILLEVKDGSKPPSKRKLTPEQERFHASWSGPLEIVTSPAEAVAAIGRHCGCTWVVE